MKQLMFNEDHQAYTNLLANQHVASWTRLEYTPCQFMKRLNKGYTIRYKIYIERILFNSDCLTYSIPHSVEANFEYELV